LLLIRGLIETGAIKPVIDRTYKLRDIADAHRYVDTGRKRGAVVVPIDVREETAFKFRSGPG
jgi:NADPH:quinone reductase-like Zn-dependent oxidoreductase